MRFKKPNTNQKAFTIVELMIATSVFAVVLLTALAAFTQIGHLFYKGVSVTQTQNTATQITQDINGYFKTASNVYIPSTPYSNSTYNYYCVGSARYTYKINSLYLTSNVPANYNPSTGNYALLKDIMPGSSACASPCIPPGTSNPAGCTSFTKPVELLGNNMRLGEFSITA